MKNRDYYIRRAEVGFKTLVIYFSVTRPQYEKAYHKDDKFDKDVLMRHMDFLSTWDKRSKREKELLAKRYSEYARTFNYTFDIPVGLVKEILGKYRRSRISIKEITDKLEADGWLEVKNAGTRTKKGEDGKAHVVCWWHKKYLIANKKYWLKLLSDKKYSDYLKYPEDKEGFVQRAVSIIAKYRKNTIKTEEKDMTTVEELKEEFIKEAGQVEKMQEVEPPKPEPEESLDDLVRAWNNKTAEVKKEQPNSNEEKTAKYFELREKYLNGVIDYTEFRNWMVSNGVKDSVLKKWDNDEMNRIQDQVQEKVQDKSKPMLNVDIDELVKLVS